jgi:hypothetical protein
MPRFIAARPRPGKPAFHTAGGVRFKRGVRQQIVRLPVRDSKQRGEDAGDGLFHGENSEREEVCGMLEICFLGEGR